MNNEKWSVVYLSRDNSNKPYSQGYSYNNYDYSYCYNNGFNPIPASISSFPAIYDQIFGTFDDAKKAEEYALSLSNGDGRVYRVLKSYGFTQKNGWTLNKF